MADDKKKKSTKVVKPKKSKKEVDAELLEGLEAVTPRLIETYKTKAVPALKAKFNYKSVMQMPKVEKVTINCGLGRSTQNIKVIEQALETIGAVTGQKSVACKSKKAISNFKLRQGLPIGVMVTLRRNHMWEFLDRLVSLTLPRIRDFRGISPKAFDGRGNYNLGLKDQLVFPEVNYDTADNVYGMNITVVTSAKTDDEARELLTQLGFPFKKPKPTQKAA